ncbi:protein of unknown function [Chitinophaga sp. CF118]|uniref:DUF4258 domain-containing protein n=1 Tax=Chitinophaga sp. CF118 TaxID=1884367 RepID=UPI0008F16A99|nr:DUF4258 domain-containing protein [Chitinophaga sp. CF118]SFD05589.1 protein of unknown function [Chitinophaga sp. CF118]
MRSKGKYIPVILLALLLFMAWHQQWWKGPRVVTPPHKSGHNTVNEPSILNRHARLEYTLHARCRMECRHITEEEVTEILTEGRINTERSNPMDLPCPTFALEGYSDEGQHLRIVFAPCDSVTRVVTCIDLDKEWNCNCN